MNALSLCKQDRFSSLFSSSTVFLLNKIISTPVLQRMQELAAKDRYCDSSLSPGFV